VNIGSYIFPDFKFQWLVKQTKQNIPKELDFTVEAQNTETIRSMFKHLKWLKVLLLLQANLNAYLFNL